MKSTKDKQQKSILEKQKMKFPVVKTGFVSFFYLWLPPWR